MFLFLQSMLSDDADCVSSKRVITLLAFLLCTVGFLAELFWGLKVSTTVYDSMMYIVVAGLGFTASEKFAPKNRSKQ